MGPTNKEVQLQKTCQIYAYLLTSLGKEVPESVEECAESYDYPIDCVKELSSALKNLDEETYKSLVQDQNSPQAQNLKNWWEMYKIYMPL